MTTSCTSSVGCQTKLKPDPNQPPRICPRCHNGILFLPSLLVPFGDSQPLSSPASVLPAKKSTWFELFFIPVVPLSRKRILMCTICGWQAAVISEECVCPSSADWLLALNQVEPH